MGSISVIKRLFLIAVFAASVATAAWAEVGEEEVNRLFVQGLAQQQAGQHADARATYITILGIRPDANRVRLELARSYFETGDYSAARREFHSVLLRSPPPQVARTIERFLRDMDRAEAGKLRMSLSFRRSSEATRRYKSNTVMLDLFGTGTPLSYTLNRPVSDKLGLEIGFGYDVQRRIDATKSVFVDVDGMYFTNGTGAFDEARIAAKWGVSDATSRGRQAFAVLGEVEIAPGMPKDFRVGGEWSRNWQLSDGSRVTISTAALLGFSGADQSEIGRLRLGLDLPDMGKSRAMLGFERRASGKASLDYHRVTASFHTAVVRTERLAVRARVGLDMKVGHSFVPGFSVKRRDQKLDVALEFSGRNWNILGLSPVLTLSKARNRSNITAYSFDSDLVASVRFGKTF